jgi:hypothetical protein
MKRTAMQAQQQDRNTANGSVGIAAVVLTLRHAPEFTTRPSIFYASIYILSIVNIKNKQL